MAEKPPHRNRSGTHAGAEPPPVASVPPVDIERLELLANGDPAALRELAEFYLQQTTPQIEQLSSAVKAGIAEEVRRLAHSCAGASSTCGMTVIVAPLRELERQSAEGHMHNAAELALSINQEFERIEQFFEDHIPLPAPQQLRAQK